ncbi:hypothetical protein [Rhizobium phage RHph_X3_2]|nr:hypothetical protein [Rhizobium phage RHph_X3_2]
MKDTVVWFTVDNLRGDSWSEFFDDFVDAETEFDKYDEEAEAIAVAEQLATRGQLRHGVTKHWVQRDGVEHTENVWEA